MVAAHCFDTIFYLLLKQKRKKEVYDLLKDYRKAFGVSAITKSMIDNALDLNWDDLEDAIHHEAARAAGCDAIITRNKKDFNKASIKVRTPQEFLDELNKN